MSTWEMIKFWFIRETMPLWIILGIVALCIIGAFLMVSIDALINKFRIRRHEH